MWLLAALFAVTCSHEVIYCAGRDCVIMVLTNKLSEQLFFHSFKRHSPLQKSYFLYPQLILLLMKFSNSRQHAMIFTDRKHSSQRRNVAGTVTKMLEGLSVFPVWLETSHVRVRDNILCFWFYLKMTSMSEFSLKSLVSHLFHTQFHGFHSEQLFANHIYLHEGVIVYWIYSKSSSSWSFTCCTCHVLYCHGDLTQHWKIWANNCFKIF